MPYGTRNNLTQRRKEKAEHKGTGEHKDAKGKKWKPLGAGTFQL
jgi:hypothetical protein